MKVTVSPSVCQHDVMIPPSKSMSHRAVICACLAEGKSIIRNLAFSDDIIATIEGMRQLGASITQHDTWIEIDGIGSEFSLQNNQIFCKESGSTLRFFIPVFSLTNQSVTFHGENRLMKRPQALYQELFQKQGLFFEQEEDIITVKGSLKAGEYEIDGNISSQFITGLLLALPLLSENSIIKVKPPFESRSYVNLTLQTMADFGVKATFLDENVIEIPGGQRYHACNYQVEGDYSQLAFFAVLGAINHDISCLGVSPNSLQGDSVIIDILRKCGVVVEEIENGYYIHHGKIQATEIDLSDCPDLGPILTVLAMYAKGTTRIYNAARLRLKESDRIEAMETELRKLGVDIHSTQDEIIIMGANGYIPREETLAHKDHRIAMSLAIAATKCQSDVVIQGAECINKSYPAFFEDLKKTGIVVLTEG